MSIFLYISTFRFLYFSVAILKYLSFFPLWSMCVLTNVLITSGFIFRTCARNVWFRVHFSCSSPYGAVL